MVKAKTNKGDIILGLSGENIKRLVDGQPILLNLKDLGLEDRKVVIMYGPTEESIAADLKTRFEEYE